MMFGEPDNIERHPNDFNRKPYQIWTYSSSQFTFVFVDVGQTGLYNLVHSTAPGEVQNHSWERDYAQMHDDPNERSTVEGEEYIFGD